MLLFEEYCDSTPEAFSYSWFCEHYKDWAGWLKPTLRQVHVAGERLFVDYSGHTMEVIDGLTLSVVLKRPRHVLASVVVPDRHA
jgi:transposase